MENSSHPKMPYVSVCLLTYNRARQLSRSIESLLTQTHRDFELIINDDNSPDDTEAICREFERRDPRVRYCRNSTNLRYAGNQNAAIERARSDYVAIVHDGDVYRPDLIEKWVKALVENPSAALVFNDLDAMDLEGRVVTRFTHPYPPLVHGRSLAIEMVQRPDSPIFGIVMVRKACVEEVGPFDLRLPTLADVDMWLRLLIRYDAAYIKEPLLKIGAREANHHNRVGNWKIKAQHELIYQLALERLFPAPSEEGRSVTINCRKMLRNDRLRWLAILLRRLNLQELWTGLMFYRTPLPKTSWMS